MTLARQFLLLQLLIVLVVLVFVAAISIAQSAADFRRVAGRAALSAAENLAATALVRERLPDAEPRLGAALPAAAESLRAQSGATGVTLVRADGVVVVSSDPTLLGEELPLGESDVLQGRSWTGVVERSGQRSVVAHVPVLSDEPARTGELVGFVVVARAYPSTLQLLQRAAPNLAIYLGVASLLGVVGSLLLSRRVKRQTLGLEPVEIASLVEHREAMLHGLKEGVVALDTHGRVTLLNDSARDLLGLPADSVGRTLAELDVDPVLGRALSEEGGVDRMVLADDRVLVLNHVPLRSRSRVIGSVTTLRDRTELSSLERELGSTRAVSDTLRAQTHEFANRLHTISGLLTLEEYDEAIGFVQGVGRERAGLDGAVTSRIGDPTVAALLIAKVSLANEKGVTLRLSPTSDLDVLDEDLSRDVTTVVGNLVDNAVDAVSGGVGGTVTVHLAATPLAVGVADVADVADGEVDRAVPRGGELPGVLVEVRDDGPGVPPGDEEAVFVQGWSTKAQAGAADAGGADAGRGFGLALTRLVCRRRGGEVAVRNDGGAVFTATLPGAPR
ncbi:sensor histidine kinase [Nocardioides perillae]|nr:ATP-binding protein [Nocardioides perillae]